VRRQLTLGVVCSRPLWSIGVVWSIGGGVRIIIIEVKPVRIVRVWGRIIIVLAIVELAVIVIIGRGFRIVIVAAAASEDSGDKNTNYKDNTQLSHARASSYS